MKMRKVDWMYALKSLPRSEILISTIEVETLLS